MRRRITLVMLTVLLLTASAVRADPPTMEDVRRSISSNVDHSDSISGKAMGGIAAAAVGVVLVAVVVNHRQSRRTPGGWSTGGGGGGPAAPRVAGPMNHPGKLVRELMRETGLTKGQLRQLAAANDRLADDDRAVEHLATLLLCPSLLTASKGGG